MGAQKVEVPKIGQNRNYLVSGKGDLTGKMVILRGFFRHVRKKLKLFLYM